MNKIRIKEHLIEWDDVQKLDLQKEKIILHMKDGTDVSVTFDSPKSAWKELGNIANQFSYAPKAGRRKERMATVGAGTPLNHP